MYMYGKNIRRDKNVKKNTITELTKYLKNRIEEYKVKLIVTFGIETYKYWAHSINTHTHIHAYKEFKINYIWILIYMCTINQ